MNERLGSKREPIGSTIAPPVDTMHGVPIISARQRRALNGPVTFRTAVTSRVRNTWASPVVVTKAGKGKRKRAYRDPLVGATRDPRGIVRTRVRARTMSGYVAVGLFWLAAALTLLR